MALRSAYAVCPLLPALAAGPLGVLAQLEHSLLGRGGILRALSSAAGAPAPPQPSAAAADAAATPSAPTAPASIPVQRLQHAITPQVCEHLRRRGYAVVDGALGEEAAAALRAEVAAVRGHMHKNCTHLVQVRWPAPECFSMR